MAESGPAQWTPMVGLGHLALNGCGAKPLKLPWAFMAFAQGVVKTNKSLWGAGAATLGDWVSNQRPMVQSQPCAWVGSLNRCDRLTAFTPRKAVGQHGR